MESLDTLIPVTQRPLAQPKGTEGTQVASLLTADVKDKPRNRPLVRMKVRNRNTAMLLVPHANPVPPGEWVISCYDDEVPAVMGLVETRQDRLRDAQKQYQRMVLSEAKKKLGTFLGTVDDLEEAITGG